MINWIKKNIFNQAEKERNINNQIKNINNKVKNINAEISAMTFIVQKQSELISAIASVQAEILQALDYEQTLYDDALDASSYEKIILISSDDDDTFH